MLRFLRSPKIRVLRARHPARRGNTRFKGTFGCTNSDSKQSRPLNELSRAQKFFERRYSRDIFASARQTSPLATETQIAQFSARVRCEKTSKRATRRQCVPLLFVDVEETEVPTKDAVRMVKPNMVELKCFLFFVVTTTIANLLLTDALLSILPFFFKFEKSQVTSQHQFEKKTRSFEKYIWEKREFVARHM